MIKIAVPTSNGVVQSHFGKSEAFTIFTVDDQHVIQGESEFQSPQGCGCKSGLAPALAEKGVNVMLAGNMGQGAVDKLQANQIEVFRGYSGQARDVVLRYLKGDTGNPVICDHHHHH
jgi:predicted Fe-Mo cluster-binding NifX family protein